MLAPPPSPTPPPAPHQFGQMVCGQVARHPVAPPPPPSSNPPTLPFPFPPCSRHKISGGPSCCPVLPMILVRPMALHGHCNQAEQPLKCHRKVHGFNSSWLYGGKGAGHPQGPKANPVCTVFRRLDCIRRAERTAWTDLRQGDKCIPGLLVLCSSITLHKHPSVMKPVICSNLQCRRWCLRSGGLPDHPSRRSGIKSAT